MKRLVAICLIGLLLPIIFLGAFAEETFDWEIARPSYFINIGERTESSYSDGIATVGLGVNIKTYYEDDGQVPSVQLKKSKERKREQSKGWER